MYQDHQTGSSPPTNHNIPCVSGFCLDYIHLVWLRVLKCILCYLKQGPRQCRLSAEQLSEISENFISLSRKLPSEFAQQPRSLEELKRWKATEFRQFLLYSGPVVLKKKNVPKELYVHFLSIDSRIFNSIGIRWKKEDFLQGCASELLAYFVLLSKRVNSYIFVSYNVHNLLHIADV
jgi:hypothetical protein